MCPQLTGILWVSAGQSSGIFEPNVPVNKKSISRNSILTCLLKKIIIPKGSEENYVLVKCHKV